MLTVIMIIGFAFLLAPAIHILMILILRPYDSEDDERKERRKKLGYDT